MNLIEREGRIVTVGFGYPDPEGESKWIDAGYCDDGYQEARDHVDSYLSARLMELTEYGVES